eukprot:COSAG06_NODE_49347_length_326_cov_0.674009_1_plen_51_part_10
MKAACSSSGRASGVLLLLLVGMSYAKLELGESVEVEGGAKGGVHLPAARCH